MAATEAKHARRSSSEGESESCGSCTEAFAIVWDSADLSQLILAHCRVRALISALATCKRLHEMDVDHLWKALVLKKWPPASSLRVASFRKLYVSWKLAEDGRRPQHSWRAELKKLQFVVSIHFYPGVGEQGRLSDMTGRPKVVLLEQTFRGEEAMPATAFNGVWEADSTPDVDEGLGWTCAPEPSAMRSFGVELDKGEPAYFDSVANLYKADTPRPGSLFCSCMVVREPQSVGMLLNAARFDVGFNGFHNMIFFESDEDTHVSIYLARDHGPASGASPPWRLLLDCKDGQGGDLPTPQCASQINRLVQWHV